MSILTKLRKKLWHSKHDFLELIDGREFTTEEEFQKFIAPMLAELLKINSDQVKEQYYLTTFKFDKSKYCDIAFFSKYNKDQIFLIIELKLERHWSNIDFYENYNEGKENAFRELQVYCQLARAEYGILLTDKNIYFTEYNFSRSSLPKVINEFPVLMNVKALDHIPAWRLFLILALFWINLVFISTVWQLVRKYYG